MSDILNPRETGEFVTKIAKNVSVSSEGVSQLAWLLHQVLSNGKYRLSAWKEQHLHPKLADETAINWIFLVDSLNFSFWPDEGNEFYISYKDKCYTGYWSLCAAINRAIDEGQPLTDANYYKDLTIDQVHNIFKAEKKDEPGVEAEIPMISERLEIMKENGAILVERFGGSFVECIKKCDKSAKKLLQLIIENFPSFRDEGFYENQKVSFYKRAQILIADIYACFEDQGLGHFDDIDELTMFPDYRVPQVLVYFNVLSYSDQLKDRLSCGEMFNHGDPDEIEIRAATIHAIELLKLEIIQVSETEKKPLPMKINSILLDFYLWDFRRSNADAVDRCISFHRTRSIFY